MVGDSSSEPSYLIKWAWIPRKTLLKKKASNSDRPCCVNREWLIPVRVDCIIYLNNFILAYVVWSSAELSSFTTHFIKQSFMPQTSLSTLTKCVILVRSQCERVCIAKVICLSSLKTVISTKNAASARKQQCTT